MGYHSLYLLIDGPKVKRGSLYAVSILKEASNRTSEQRKMMSPTILLFALLLLPLYLLLKTTIYGSSSTLPPSPPKLPIFGNLHQLGSLPHRSLRALSDKLGPLMYLRLGSFPALVVSSAEAAREVMRTHDLVFASRPSSKVARVLMYNSEDLAFSPYGEHWRKMRKLCVTHMLSSKMVESFGDMRKEEVGLMLEKISSMGNTVVDMSEVLFSFSNDVMCRVVSGKFLGEDGRNAMFRELIEENIQLFGEVHIEDFLPKLAWLDMFIGLTARAERNSRRWDEVLEKIIRDHDQRSKETGFRKEDFVDVLLGLQKDGDTDFAFTKDHIKALLLDMFAAGTDTSYTVLEWTLTELIRHPEVMKKLEFEVRAIAIGKASIEEDDLNQMSYLKAVLKETLRLHPPATLLIPRESIKEGRIQGYDIPKKTRVIINAWAIGRDHKSWEAAEDFLPERFVDSSIDFRGNDFQLIPFGAGRRICPGINFSVSTMELAIANLVHKFNWELPTGMRIEELDMEEAPGFVTHKKQGLKLLAKPFHHLC